MPQMANITVKKANGTTDIVWTALTPSAGDSSPARWRSDTASLIPGNRPTFDLLTVYNGPKTARRAKGSAKFPVVKTENSVEVLKGTIPLEMSILIPQGLEETDAAEAVAQLFGLMFSQLFRDSVKSGYAPT